MLARLTPHSTVHTPHSTLHTQAFPGQQSLYEAQGRLGHTASLMETIQVELLVKLRMESFNIYWKFKLRP